MMTYDAIVIGLGGMGSAAAYQLAQRGLRVLGLEQFTPAHNLGSSHGGSRIIREAYFEAPEYVPLVQRAYNLWRALEAETGETLLQITGGLMIGRPGTELVRGSITSAQQHGLAHEILSSSELRHRFPAFHPGEDEIGVYEARAGILHPEACVMAHVAVAQRHGAELHFEEPVLRWEAHEDGVAVETSEARYTADRLIITAGPWASKLIPQLGRHLRVERTPVYWFRPQANSAALAPGHCPIYIWQRDDVGFLYGFPLDDAGLAKAALHYGGQITTADTIDRTVHGEEAEAMRAIMRQCIPTLDVEPAHTSICMYTNSPDRHFIIDRHQEHAHVVLAAGFSGHGFKFCNVVGELLATLAFDTAAETVPLFRWARLG